MDDEETDRPSQQADNPSLSNLSSVEEARLLDDLDLGLNSSKPSNHSSSRSPCTPVPVEQPALLTQVASPSTYAYTNQDFNFDPNDIPPDNGAAAPPRMNDKPTNNVEARSRQGEEVMAEIYDSFKNDTVRQNDNTTPAKSTSSLLTQPESSDANERGEELDVDQLLVRYDLGHAASKNPTPLSPKVSVPAEPANDCSLVDLASNENTRQKMASPCYANPQSPAASEKGSPKGTKPLAPVDSTEETVPQLPSITFLHHNPKDTMPISRIRKQSEASDSKNEASKPNGPSQTCASAAASRHNIRSVAHHDESSSCAALIVQKSPISGMAITKLTKPPSAHTTLTKEIHPLVSIARASSKDTLALPRLARDENNSPASHTALKGAPSLGLGMQITATGTQHSHAAVVPRAEGGVSIPSGLTNATGSSPKGKVNLTCEKATGIDPRMSSSAAAQDYLSKHQVQMHGTDGELPTPGQSTGANGALVCTQGPVLGETTPKMISTCLDTNRDNVSVEDQQFCERNVERSVSTDAKTASLLSSSSLVSKEEQHFLSHADDSVEKSVGDKCMARSVHGEGASSDTTTSKVSRPSSYPNDVDMEEAVGKTGNVAPNDTEAPPQHITDRDNAISTMGQDSAMDMNKSTTSRSPMEEQSPVVSVKSSLNQEEALPSHESDSSASSDTSFESDIESLSGSQYMERAAARKRSNEQLWLKISGTPPPSTREPSKKRRHNDEACDEGDSQEDSERNPQPIGMLFRTPWNNIHSELKETSVSGKSPFGSEREIPVEQLYSRYPYRESQIKMLLSLMGSSIHQAEAATTRSYDGDMIYAPTPIFVTGPSGTGKTSVVRDVVNTLKLVHSAPSEVCDPSHLPPFIGSAYVNCAVIEPCSIDTVVESAFAQLVAHVPSVRQLRKRRKRKRSQSKAQGYTKAGHDEPSACELPTVQEQSSSDGPKEKTHDLLVADDLENIEDLEDLVEEERKMKLDSDMLSKPSVVQFPRKSERKGNDAKLRAEPSDGNCQFHGTSRQVEERTAAHAVPLAFGRAIAPFFGADVITSSTLERRGCGFLILDNAERLLALAPSKARVERNNFLAQLLLLPQVVGLNLTVVVITRSTLLEYSRVNNVAPPQKSLGTIKDALRPFRVYFSAYKETKVFKAILNKPRMRQLIEGRCSSLNPLENEDSKKAEFQNRLYDSFLEILIQSLSSSTRDVRDMISLGDLWPTYIEPLRPDQVKTTLASIRSRVLRKAVGEGSSADLACTLDTDTIQKEILMVLDQKILPRVRSQLGGFFALKCDFPPKTDAGKTAAPACERTSYDTSYDLPCLSKCIVLAAFICQTNKPDKDQQLLTIRKNGKRSSTRAGGGETSGDMEGIAYGSTTWERQRRKILRPRSFPLERMLSVFVNITGLLQSGSHILFPEGETNVEEVLRFMGSDCFFESLAQIRDIGILREVDTSSKGKAAGDPANVKYWCSLKRDEAEALAQSIDFPLFKFLI